MEYRAVVVDDEILTVEALTKLIPLCCSEIKVVGNAGNGKTALELICSLEPDIAVVDINMPEINGIQLIQTLKERGAHTKIVVLSAYREFEYAVNALNYGAFAYLLKPVNVENVRNTMKELAECIEREKTAQQVQKKYVEILPDLGKNVFLKFLDGKLSCEEMRREVKAMQIKLPKEFRAGIIKLLPIEIGMERNGRAREILSTFQGKFILCAELENNEMVLLLKADGAYNQLALLGKELMSGGIPYIIYLGEKSCDYHELYQSFRKIRETEWFHFYLDFTDRIVKCGEFEFFRECRKTFQFDSSLIKRWIHEKDQEAVINYLHSCADKWKEEMAVSPQILYQAVYELILILKSEIPITDGGLRYALDNLTQEDLRKYTTLSSMIRYAEGLIMRIFDMNTVDQVEEPVKDKVIIMVKDYCSRHYGDDISLDDISDYVNMSKNYFCNYFKKNTGENFIQYLKKLRIDIAMRKLREGNDKIADVAQEVGYRNVSHFSKMFKEETGISPVEYRNRKY